MRTKKQAETIKTKVIKCLSNDITFMTGFNMFNEYNDKETIESYLHIWDDNTVILSNENNFQWEGYTLHESLTQALNKKGLNFEFYDGGTITIFEED